MKDLALSWPIKSRGLNRVPLFLDQYSLHICMIRLSAPSIVLVYHLLRLISFHFCQITRSHNNDTHVWLQKITVKRSKTGVPPVRDGACIGHYNMRKRTEQNTYHGCKAISDNPTLELII